MSTYRPAPTLLASLPSELHLEIISRLLDQSDSESTTCFQTRMKILANLSLTTHFFHDLIVSTPTLWSEVEINVIRDVACSPPISFLEQIFRRSGEIKMSVKLIHWGEEREDYNEAKGWEWVPGATREIRKLLDNNQHRIQALRLEFHHLNGTEYSCRKDAIEASWKGLMELEIYAHDWVTVHSLPMGWLKSVITSASPKSVTIRGSGAFGWSILGRDMSGIKVLRVDTEITESMALGIISRTPMVEECRFSRIIQVSQVESHLAGSGSIKLLTLRKLHVGSLKGVGNFLSRITTPELQVLEVGFVETQKVRWDLELFRRFVNQSGIGSPLRRLVLLKTTMSGEALKECESMFSSSLLMEVTDRVT